MPMTFDQYSFCSLGCLYCTVDGTRIGSDKPGSKIEQLKIGDVVYSYNTKTRQVEKDRIVSTMERTVSTVLKITLENGTVVELTKEHPVFVLSRGWVPAGSLKDGDDVLFTAKPKISFLLTKRNPMRVKSTASRMAKTLHQRYAAGQFAELQKKLAQSGRKNLIAWNKSPRASAAVSRRMKRNNPMKRAKVSKAVSQRRKEQFQSGALVPYWLGRLKPDAVVRMTGPKNPMKNPSVRKATLQKAVATWNRNGRISEGELLVKKALRNLRFNFLHQPVVLLEEKKRTFILDFLITDVNVCVEYDGHSKHFTPKGKANDRKRDALLLQEFGIRTIRIHRDEAFIGNQSLMKLIMKKLEAL